MRKIIYIIVKLKNPAKRKRNNVKKWAISDIKNKKRNKYMSRDEENTTIKGIKMNY